MMDILLFAMVAAVAFGTLLVIWGLGSFIAFIRNQYRKHIWRTALYIAQERPDLLGEVAPMIEAPTTSEVAIPAEFAEPSRPRDSIHTVPRHQLEDHCIAMEAAVIGIRDRWLEEYQEKQLWKQKVEHMDKLRERYWKRIKRVDAAEKQHGDVFAALHPALARMAVAA